MRGVRILTFLIYMLMLVLSIIQAFATLGIGIIIGMIYMWKVGLVGLGISSHTY